MRGQGPASLACRPLAISWSYCEAFPLLGGLGPGELDGGGGAGEFELTVGGLLLLGLLGLFTGPELDGLDEFDELVGTVPPDGVQVRVGGQ